MGTFPDSVVNQAWLRSGGICECTRTTHSWHPGGRCSQKLRYNDRGRRTGFGWEAHHKVAEKHGGQDILSNCEILCLGCHKATKTFGE